MRIVTISTTPTEKTLLEIGMRHDIPTFAPSGNSEVLGLRPVFDGLCCALNCYLNYLSFYSIHFFLLHNKNATEGNEWDDPQI